MSGVSGSPEGSSDLIGLTSAAVTVKKKKLVQLKFSRQPTAQNF